MKKRISRLSAGASCLGGRWLLVRKTTRPKATVTLVLMAMEGNEVTGSWLLLVGGA